MPRKIREEDVDTRVSCRLPAEFISVVNQWAREDWLSVSLLMRNLVIAGAQQRLRAEGKEPITPGDGNGCSILPKSRVGVGAPLSLKTMAAARDLDPAAAGTAA
jgi:hypothetical protein